MWVKIARIAKVVQNLTIIGGIFVGLGSLVFGQMNRRIEAVGGYRKDYIDHIRKDYVKFVSTWNAFGSNTLTATDDRIKEIVDAFYEKGDNQTDLLTFGDFFHELWFCVNTNRCDRNTALDAFEVQAAAIYEVSAYYIGEKRKKDRDRDFCQGLENFYRLERQSYLGRLFTIPQ